MQGSVRAIATGRRRPIGLALLLLAVTLALSLVPLGRARSAAGAPVLLSQGRLTTASSQASPAFAPAKAVDGSSRTRWASVSGVDPQWIQVDLGAVYRVTRVVLTWEVAHAVVYQVQASVDGSRWTSLHVTSSGRGGTQDVSGLVGSGRYLRVLGTRRGTTYGYSLWDLRVYGAADPGRSAGPSLTGPTLERPSSTGPALAGPSSTGPSPVAATSSTGSAPATGTGLRDPIKKNLAMMLVSSAENSSLDWRAQYAYVEDLADGRGYTAGIIGFCSGTGDLLDLVTRYTAVVPGNVLARYLPALHRVNGSASHAGLDPGFTADWRAAAQDPRFRRAQDAERDDVYFDPAVGQAERDGLHALGQFIYYDAMVMHGPGGDPLSFGGIRQQAMRVAKTPAQGGSEVGYLHAFLDARKAVMLREVAHSDTSRLDTQQRVFLTAGNLSLNPPLRWKVYGDSYSIP